MFVLHQCDNPLCINTDHLFLGTHEDNMADMARKGRARGHVMRGTEQPRTKLTEADVATIRESARTKRSTQREMATAFGISLTTLQKIIYRKAWAHVPDRCDEPAEPSINVFSAVTSVSSTSGEQTPGPASVGSGEHGASS